MKLVEEQRNPNVVEYVDPDFESIRAPQFFDFSVGDDNPLCEGDSWFGEFALLVL